MWVKAGPRGKAKLWDKAEPGRFGRVPFWMDVVYLLSAAWGNDDRETILPDDFS